MLQTMLNHAIKQGSTTQLSAAQGNNQVALIWQLPKDVACSDSHSLLCWHHKASKYNQEVQLCPRACMVFKLA
jgi:hypothetical protein